MKYKMITILPILLLTFLAPAGVLFAREGGNSRDGRGDENRVRVEFKNEADEEEAPAALGATQFESSNQAFEARGPITSISGNSFVVAGHTVVIDLTRVSKFEQKGTLAVGAMVKVEGIVRDGTNFAREVKVLGVGSSGNEEFRFRAEGTPSVQVATPAASTSEQPKVEIKARGTLDQIINFLQQIITSLRKTL